MKKESRKEVLKQNLSYAVTGKIWLECEEEKFFGPGPVELLQNIERTGSINKAAKQMAMSYKKAWDLVNQLNAKALKPFVITKSGGQEGGGSIITDEAKAFIVFYAELRNKFSSFLQTETKALMLRFC